METTLFPETPEVIQLLEDRMTDDTAVYLVRTDKYKYICVPRNIAGGGWVLRHNNALRAWIYYQVAPKETLLRIARERWPCARLIDWWDISPPHMFSKKYKLTVKRITPKSV